jgi:hypothetical protein
MQCTTHSETVASGTCTYSGKAFCSDCLIEVEGKLVGKTYLDRVMEQARDHASKSHNPMIFMNAGGGGGAAAASAVASSSPQVATIGEPKSKVVAYILLCFSIVCLCGMQRFYLRQWLVGTIYLFTLGLLGAGTIFDVFMLGNRVDIYNALRGRRIIN